MPDRNAKVLELYHKPTPQHLLEGILSHGCAFGFADSLDEYAMVGYKHDEPWAFAIERQDSHTVCVSKKLASGAVIRRIIRLAEDDLQKIEFKTTITHRGEPEHVYQFYVRCDFGGPLDVGSQMAMQGYGHLNTWQLLSPGWYLSEELAAPVLYGSRVDGMSLVNPDTQTGVTVRFDRAKTFRPQLALKSISHRADMELLTQRFQLHPEESAEYAYTLEFTAEAPRE